EVAWLPASAGRGQSFQALTVKLSVPVSLPGLRGTRTVWGGRAPVRAVLYRGTLVATRRHPVLRAFSWRLVTAGTPKNVALNVVCPLAWAVNAAVSGQLG
ncbi:MAG: hypothetical protein M3541_09440, partial [Acidobacteriota bacterium]|nr:hypothetical protein [Acidobacteriota bacterium]